MNKSIPFINWFSSCDCQICRNREKKKKDKFIFNRNKCFWLEEAIWTNAKIQNTTVFSIDSFLFFFYIYSNYAMYNVMRQFWSSSEKTVIIYRGKKYIMYVPDLAFQHRKILFMHLPSPQLITYSAAEFIGQTISLKKRRNMSLYWKSKTINAKVRSKMLKLLK